MGGRTEPKLANERLTQAFALFCLLLMGGWVLFGPSGLLAWNENSRLLIERHKELAQLTVERDARPFRGAELLYAPVSTSRCC
jgi:hypothetical protein